MEEESKTERTKGINLRNKTQVQFLVQPKSNVPWTEKRAQHIYVHLFEMWAPNGLEHFSSNQPFSFRKWFKLVLKKINQPKNGPAKN